MTPWNTTTPRDDGVTTVRRSWRAEIIHPDGTVTVEVYKDSVSKYNLAALYTGAIVHQGVAAAVLTIQLTLDTVATPAVLAEA